MDKKFYVKNREKLLSRLEDYSLVVLHATTPSVKSEDEDYEYTPNRDFLYLSGVNEANDVLVLYKGIEDEEFMFITRFDETKAKWVGRTYNEKEIKTMSGVDKIFYLDEMESIMNKFVKNHKVKKIYFDFNGYKEIKDSPNYRFYEVNFKKYLNKCYDVYPTLAQIRLVKEKEEVEEIKKAIHITNIALEEVKKNIKDGQSEKELEALFAYHIKRNGASDLAFNTICASGIHSCTLHYSSNTDTMHKGDVILFDLGAEFNYYKADISRTFPVSGKFSPRQQQIYDIVLGAQQVTMNLAKPGVTIMELNDAIIKYYQVELKKIGLIKNDEEVKKYYFHSVSHPIGLDTHDVAMFNPRKNVKLEEGWIISNEPGLYIEEEKIGVRIEDDLYITKDGCINLSEEIAK